MATKTEKMRFWIVAHSKLCYVGKVPKLIFEKLTLKKISILKYFWLEKYLKVVFSTESVWKIANSNSWNWKTHENQKWVK